jgi:hypothetical protein
MLRTKERDLRTIKGREKEILTSKKKELEEGRT